MKITRALLLSSQKQAEAWERTLINTFIVAQYRTDYRYLVTENKLAGQLQLQIFRVAQRKHEERTYNVLSDVPHVEMAFEGTDELTTFLSSHQIDFENGWQPVEGSSDNPQT